MTEAALAIAEDDPIFESDIMKEMVKQMRALDTYDTYEGWSSAILMKSPSPA